MILPNTSLADGMAVCEEIRATIASTTFLEREWGFSMPPLRLHGVLSASIGIAQYVPGAADAPSELERSELLRRADAAMYRAKSLGKNQVVVWRAEDYSMAASGN
jgi:PleD family two-component response regulator